MPFFTGLDAAIAILKRFWWVLPLSALLMWGMRVDHLRGRYKAALAVLAEQAQTVVLAVREASGNDAVTWDTARGQVVALGISNRSLKGAIAEQNASIDAWAREAAARKAEAAEWKRIADKAEAQRRSALRRLSDMAITPGTRDDCMTLLQEAEAALDLAREAGA
jgi:hypothetical protein